MTTPAGTTRALVGTGVGRGAAAGPVARAHPAPRLPEDAGTTTDPEGDAARLTAAFAAVATALRERAGAAEGVLAEVLDATALFAQDPALVDASVARVRAGVAPAAAVHQVTEQLVASFRAAGGYLAERATDLGSVRDRVVARLLGLPEPGVPALRVPSVVVAEDLSPADTAALDLSRVLAIVIEHGGPTSHTAIVAGQLGLPCVVRVAGADLLTDGQPVAVDAARGTVLPDPDEAALRAVAARRAALARLAEDHAPGSTADGHPVQLLANIGTVADAERAGRESAEGVGLFRTEVLFLDAALAPTLDEQTDVYAAVLTAGEGKVVVRTLDAGADKPLAFATLPGEENPALGVRGYRLVRRAPELLTTQLAALAAAARRTGRTPWVMAPMISTPAEAAQFAAAARAAGIATVGVMVEVPAAALRARDILAEVDFVSLGTNDLAQYTMATDRLRGELADLLDPWQPAVLQLVATTAAAGRDLGRPVGVCGESAADPLMALVLTGLGITSLSMSSGAVPTVRYALRQHTLAACQAMARAALDAPDAVAGRAAVAAAVDPGVRDALGVEGGA